MTLQDRVSIVLCAWMSAAGCTGSIADNGERPAGVPTGNQPGPPGDPAIPVGEPPATGPLAAPHHFPTALRRLTRAELTRTIDDLTGVDVSGEVVNLPEDFAEAGDVFAFDNKYTHQQPSAALVTATKNLADVVGAAVLSDAAVRARVVPCKPARAADVACLRTFVSSFGRRAFRRALTPDEVDAYLTKLTPVATDANDFYRAVAVGVRAFLQDLEFLYRVEVGTQVSGSPGVSKLGGYEVASRLSYFLWGTAPDEALLAAAEAGDRLQGPEAVRAAAARMLGDARARVGVDRFFALWLGYERQPPPAPLARSMLDETTALIERVIFDERSSWLDLFRARETFVDRELAAHYGLPAPAAPGFVPYGATGRLGILSHATFLGVERKHQDTSPTMRGHFIRTRLLCQEVPAPPGDVDTDNVPTAGDCKSDRFAMWKLPGCQGCHLMMDPIGHGLEGYDRVGRRRTVAPDDASRATACALTEEGQLHGVSAAGGPVPFKGVAGLAERLVESGRLEACVTTQVAHFLLGREVRDPERPLLDAMVERFRAGGHRFDQLLLDFVSLPGFGHRLAE